MTKLFKNSKQVLSFVLAFAVLAVSLFTGVVINSDAACVGETIYWSGSEGSETVDTINDAVNDVKQAGTAADPIIIDNAEELYVLQKLAGAASANNHYKIKDGISAIVLQEKGKAAANVLDLADAQAVRNHFESNPDGLRKWWSANSGVTFQGTFDGNGVTIYGLYGPDANGGLFSRGSGNPTLKNFTIKNSYRRTYASGLILGAMSNGDYGNTATVENVAIINNCMIGWNSTSVAVGNMALIGSFNKTTPRLNNLLVYGNLARFEGADSMAGRVAQLGVIATYGKEPGTPWFTNSVILGVTPYGPTGAYTDASGTEQPATQTYGYTRNRPTNFSGVYTDMPTTDVAWSNQTENYTADQIAPITIDGIKGSAAAAAMPKLDWTNTWVETKGMPEFRAFHNLTAVTPDANGHGYKCADCDIDAVVAHTWDGNECTECGYTCNHASQTVTKTDAATCVSKETVYSTCNNCKQELTVQVGVDPVGHNVTWVEPNPADCVNTGVYGYWHCSVCDGNYVAETEEEAKWAPMDSSYANPETDLIIPADPNGGHIKDVDADGKIIVGYDKDGHWYECSVCDGKLDHNSETLPEGQVVAHNFSASVCKECGWKCEEHDYQLTGNILVVGDCYTDHEDELKCTICGKQESKVTKARHKIVPVEEVKATDNLEGTKAHYQCTECKSIYADVEGKTSVTRASLVIPKKLPAGYENTYEGAGNDTTVPENADTSNKSPSTADSVMTAVAAITVLMGAAFVVVRKAVKA